MLNFEKVKEGKELKGVGVGYMGDGIFEVYVRDQVVERGGRKGNEVEKGGRKIV
ncbi:hypothetical protein [Bacillus pumilus]|uniref:hypothetical protein n=1 Tax=Bacillus pumilus TaxID=1408 RepID=UPI001642D1C1|nr:hypothetical protein [Bacillus pumilus]